MRRIALGALICALTLTPVAHAATPLWNGDTFTLDRTGTKAQGGEGTLPPYQWSSAWLSGQGFLTHSNSNPAVMGATMVEDPSPLTRQVIKLNADESRNNGSYTRMEVRGKAQFGPGMDRWVITEVFIPASTSTMTAAGWWTITSIFGPPYGGASPNSFSMRRNSAGTGNDITWLTPEGRLLWHTPATKGVWHILARKIRFSTSATDGYSEVWYSQRNADGTLTKPLTRQTITTPTGATTQTYHYVTLGPNNWNGSGLNHADVKNYHTSGMFTGLIPLYFAGHRVYDGAVPVAEIDPYQPPAPTPTPTPTPPPTC